MKLGYGTGQTRQRGVTSQAAILEILVRHMHSGPKALRLKEAKQRSQLMFNGQGMLFAPAGCSYQDRFA